MTMKKFSLAVAMGSAIVAPDVEAQTVEVYGKLYPFVLAERGSGATAAGTPVATIAGTPTGANAVGNIKGMAAGNSRLGFRGQEDLGGGMKGFFQLETTVSVDSGAGGTWNRDTFVGLGGPFGTIRLGNMDTIFKNYGDTIGALGLGSGTFLSTSDVLRKTGFGSSSASSFHLRRANSVVYESPVIANAQLGLQASTDESPSGTRNPRVFSMGVRYDAGPIYVALAHEIHDDLFGGSANARAAQRNNAATDPTNSKDTATELAVEWRMNKDHKFEIDLVRKSYKENATITGRFQSYRNNAILLAMENRWSEQWRTSAHYVRATAGSCQLVNATCATDGLEGSKVAVVAGYYFSKRTYAFGAVSRITNGKSARYSNASFSGPANPGEEVTHAALGLSHSF
jgi:predicted porin